MRKYLPPWRSQRRRDCSLPHMRSRLCHYS